MTYGESQLKASDFSNLIIDCNRDLDSVNNKLCAMEVRNKSPETLKAIDGLTKERSQLFKKRRIYKKGLDAVLNYPPMR